MTLRVCPTPGCPTLTNGGPCTQHRRQADKQRGRRQQRGYNRSHDQARRTVKAQVDQGGIRCWRCGQPINPGDPFDLGHDDTDRSVYRGPEHPSCNRATAGRRGGG